MRVLRTIAMNPVEPAPMSMRVPAKTAVNIVIQYLSILGEKLTDDLAAQLQVTSRTNDTTDVYPVPATDVVNGVAQASIPKDALTDMNGYRLRLVGTYQGEGVLLALGTLRLVEAAGIEDTPEDVIDNVPITISYNFDCAITIRLWQDAGKTIPFDLSAATINASVYASRSGGPLADFTVTPTGLPGQIVLGLTYDVVNTLPTPCWWSLQAASAGGTTTLCEGTMTITGVVPP